MGIAFTRLFSSLFNNREARILVLGLDNAGKTTILCTARSLLLSTLRSCLFRFVFVLIFCFCCFSQIGSRWGKSSQPFLVSVFLDYLVFYNVFFSVSKFKCLFSYRIQCGDCALQEYQVSSVGSGYVHFLLLESTSICIASHFCCLYSSMDLTIKKENHHRFTSITFQIF